jgi:hypothetical protein
MVRLAVTPEQAAWIAARVAAFPTEAPPGQIWWDGQYVAQFGALPLGVGWWETIGIRADGEIVSWCTDDSGPAGDYPGVRPVKGPEWLKALVVGARQYEELRDLLPPRPTDAVDCQHLDHPMFTEGKVLCPRCFGLGWARPSRVTKN